MAEAPRAGAVADAATQATKRRLGIETVLGVAGALIVLGFFLPWIDLPGGRASGLDVALTGGVWTGIAAIPALGLITAVLGGLRWRASRYAGAATALAMLVPVAYLLATHWPWLYAIPLAVGVAALVLGKLARAPWLNLPLGGVLLVGSVIVPLLVWTGRLPDFADDLGIVAAVPLVGLAVLMPVSAVWLLWSGLRKKNRERALVVTGYSIIALDAYVAGLVAFGPTLITAGVGLWMSALGGAVLLLVSRPLATRRKREPSRAAGAEPAKVAEAAKPAPARKDAKPAPAPKDAAPAPEQAPPKKPTPEQLAKLEMLKQKKLEMLAARKRAAAKAAEEEAATAKAGAALADEPEPTFAADPTAAPPPENEDREALMQRMGVKAPPPPSASDLEDMLAALKQRAAADD